MLFHNWILFKLRHSQVLNELLDVLFEVRHLDQVIYWLAFSYLDQKPYAFVISAVKLRVLPFALKKYLRKIESVPLVLNSFVLMRRL